jgi:hypothetical protein
MAEDRREALKIIGAIGSTCAFPFSADELHAQHAHDAGLAPAQLPAKPRFFSPAEMETVARLADLVIPATDTPGALAAGVPAYIDLVVSNNVDAQRLFRSGLAWLDLQTKRRHSKERFVQLTESEQVAMLDPLCREADQAPRFTGPRTGGLPERPPWTAGLGARFFRSMKGLVSDGFFTSKEGLVDTLRYSGNSVRGEYPVCIHEH